VVPGVPAPLSPPGLDFVAEKKINKTEITREKIDFDIVHNNM
jgi:hypothetical protein